MGNITTDKEMSEKNEILIQRPLGRLRLQATQVGKLLDEKSLIDSILLMVINKENVWENQFEVEFSKEDAKTFLSTYLKESGYSNELIEKTLNNL